MDSTATVRLSAYGTFTEGDKSVIYNPTGLLQSIVRPIGGLTYYQRKLATFLEFSHRAIGSKVIETDAVGLPHCVDFHFNDGLVFRWNGVPVQDLKEHTSLLRETKEISFNYREGYLTARVTYLPDGTADFMLSADPTKVNCDNILPWRPTREASSLVDFMGVLDSAPAGLRGVAQKLPQANKKDLGMIVPCAIAKIKDTEYQTKRYQLTVGIGMTSNVDIFTDSANNVCMVGLDRLSGMEVAFTAVNRNRIVGLWYAMATIALGPTLGCQMVSPTSETTTATTKQFLEAYPEFHRQIMAV